MRVKDNTKGINKFLRKFAEENLYKILQEMGNTKASIDNFQKKRVRQSMFLVIVFLIIGITFTYWGLALAIIIPVIFYKAKYNKVKKIYANFKFERHLQFSKFSRLLIPYLKQSKGRTSLYQVFNKISRRMENETDIKSLMKLMNQMSDDSNNIQPFLDFAERSSGSDMAVLFMSTIFDFQQRSFDTSVVDELGKIASSELQKGIDEIIDFKLRRFTFFPTKIVMTSFIIVVGFALSILYFNISQIKL